MTGIIEWEEGIQLFRIVFSDGELLHAGGFNIEFSLLWNFTLIFSRFTVCSSEIRHRKRLVLRTWSFSLIKVIHVLVECQLVINPYLKYLIDLTLSRILNTNGINFNSVPVSVCFVHLLINTDSSFCFVV